jgi:hypothetical protein
MGHGDVEGHDFCGVTKSGNWGEEREKKLVGGGEVELDLCVLLGGSEWRGHFGELKAVTEKGNC